MSVVLLVSATSEDTRRLVANGPRRDFLALATRTGATVVYRDGRKKPRGIRSKLLGPHVRQAWHAARNAQHSDTIFADGEHIGLPLVMFLAMQRKRSRVVFLGHYVSKPWKRRAIGAASLLNRDVTMAVHSVVQQRSAQRASRGRWNIALIPYQVDTGFWKPQLPPDCAANPRIIAVGSEHRDYATLAEAVRDLPVEVTIAAGSHWARDEADEANAASLPGNMQLFTKPLSFAELRNLYATATMVVVPLEDVPNQSGITVMLEAMAMGLPIIVTASKGQRECDAGPLVRAGVPSCAPLAGRGPHLFGASDTPAPNGLYVAPGDAAGLGAAITRLIDNPALRRTIAENGRRTVEATFTVEAYVANLAGLLAAGGDE